MKWQDAQKEIAVCQGCADRWKELVTQPLQVGEIPDPPPIVKILFVGVAPTNRKGENKGTHFYSAARDNLRKGLFRLLEERFRIR
jgi:uracil-DNA glycosylase